MKILPKIRATSVSGLGTMIAPFQYMATNVQASGPDTTGSWMKRAYPGWRKYSDDRLMKFSMTINSAQPNSDRTKSITKAK